MTETLPARWYRDPAIFERERQVLGAEDAGVYDTGVLSPTHEGGLALLHRLVREAVGE